MNKRTSIGSRPTADPHIDGWIRGADASRSSRPVGATVYTARLTLDVTPELRGRIKVAAFHRGVTVAKMLRDLLEKEFPERPGKP